MKFNILNHTYPYDFKNNILWADDDLDTSSHFLTPLSNTNNNTTTNILPNKPIYSSFTSHNIFSILDQK
jgi:hypothetical protein